MNELQRKWALLNAVSDYGMASRALGRVMSAGPEEFEPAKVAAEAAFNKVLELIYPDAFLATARKGANHA